MNKLLFSAALLFSLQVNAGEFNYNVYPHTAYRTVYADCSAPPWTCSVVDPVKMQEKKDFIRNYWQQIRWLGAEADCAFYEGDPDAARNAQKWFLDYSDNDGLFQNLTNGYDEREISEGFYEIHYSFGVVAMSYYKTRSNLSAEDQKKVETWLRRVVEINFYDANSKIGGFRVRGKNNHYYALSTGIMAAGVALGDKRFIRDARGIIDEAISEMSSDGSWKTELKRRQYSGHYQMMLLSHVLSAANIYKIEDREGAEKRLKKLSTAELFTARLITDNELHKKLTGSDVAMDYDFNPKSRCTGSVWAWANLTENQEAKALIDAQYAQAYSDCSNDYMVGGNVAKAKALIFK